MLDSNKFAGRRTGRRTRRKGSCRQSRWLNWARRLGCRYLLLRSRRHAIKLRLLRRLFRSGWAGDSRCSFSASHRVHLAFGIRLTLRRTRSLSPVHSVRRWKLVTKRWDIRKFLVRHVSIGLRTVGTLATSTVHTAHREIVRVMRPLEQRYVRVPAGELPVRADLALQARRADLAFDQRQATFAVQGRQLPPPAFGVPPISAVDVSHIADQVMRQLDHRISAWRERRGRT